MQVLLDCCEMYGWGLKVNNLPLGRDVDEMIRVVDALQYTEKHGEVCPAGWRKGDMAMKPTADGVSKYLSQRAAKL